MFSVVKRFFSSASEDGRETTPGGGHDVRVAVCALLVEMARIDETFTPAELEAVLSILKDRYGLSAEHAEALIAAAERELAESVDLWQFARLINAHYSNEEKIEIIETLWRIVYVDGRMDKYENYLMKKLSNLLRLSQRQLIDAKLKILDAERDRG